MLAVPAVSHLLGQEAGLTQPLLGAHRPQTLFQLGPQAPLGAAHGRRRRHLSDQPRPCARPRFRVVGAPPPARLQPPARNGALRCQGEGPGSAGTPGGGGGVRGLRGTGVRLRARRSPREGPGSVQPPGRIGAARGGGRGVSARCGLRSRVAGGRLLSGLSAALGRRLLRPPWPRASGRVAPAARAALAHRGLGERGTVRP